MFLSLTAGCLQKKKTELEVETQMGIPQNKSGYLGGIPRNN